MGLEQQLERIATALEKIAGNGVASAAPTTPAAAKADAEDPAESAAAKKKALAAEKKAAKKAEKDAAAAQPKPKTKDDIRTAMREYRKTHEKQEAVDVLEMAGATSISKLDDDKIEEVFEAFSS